MTCGSCKASVENSLRDIDDVSDVEVNLENQEATITMDKHIDIVELQKSLASKYTITQKEIKNVFTSTQSSSFEIEEEKSKLQQLKPLLLIIFYIASASVLLNYKNWSWSEFMLDFMGLFYIVFSFFKMLDLKGVGGVTYTFSTVLMFDLGEDSAFYYHTVVWANGESVDDSSRESRNYQEAANYGEILMEIVCEEDDDSDDPSQG